MSYKVYTTSSFEKDVKILVKKHPSIKNDLAKLASRLIDNPFAGTPLGKDCYKIRMAITSKGKGKSGGARVITCVKVVQDTIYLVKLYDKTTKSTIGEKELDLLLSTCGLQ